MRNLLIMEDLKIYSLNITAIIISYLEELNPLLQTIVLFLTILYTLIKIFKKLNENG